MELEFDITQSFNDDMAQLPPEQIERAKDQINLVADSLLNGKTALKQNSSIP